MITFTVKFLLAFSLKSKNKPSTEKKKSNKNIGKIGSNSKNQKLLETKIEDPPYLIRLNKTCSSAHIEYEILPGKIKLYQIDVLCWENAAKIYTADSTKLFKIITKNGLTFVPICIQHFAKDLSIDELMALQNNVIQFNVFTDKHKLGAAAKSNKTEMIYIRETDISREGFVEGFSEIINMSDSLKKSLTDDMSRISTSSKFEAYSRMKFEPDFADQLYPIIDFIFQENQDEVILFTDFVRSCANDASESKKPDKNNKKTEKSSGKHTLQMQGEIFFVENNAIFQIENYKSEISKMFVLPKVENLLTRNQKIYLNPIVIKLESVENFPEVFENSGFTDIYCKYSIPGIGECKTIEKPIGKTIFFMESHFFPTHNLSKIKLIEFLGSKKLIVDIFGIQRYQQVKPNPKMFGEKQGDFKISKIDAGFRRRCLESDENLKTKNILLAYCTFDLSSLLRNLWDYRGSAQLITGDNRFEARSLSNLQNNPTNDNYSCEFWTHYGISINQINLAGIYNQNTHLTPLKEWLLMQNNTLLNLEAYILSPQSSALVLHQIPNTFKRLFMIAFNKDVAVRLFNCILRHNQKIICNKRNSEDLLTGFVIDNGNNFVIYVEGPSIGYILNLVQELDNVTPEEAKLFFNTDQAYENRLYNICNKWNGLYSVVLKIPLQLIFKNQKVYVKGNMPLLCRRVLIKLDLLLKSNTMKKMFQNELFPTLDELICLDIEYGVPCSWKSYQISELSSSISAFIG